MLLTPTELERLNHFLAQLNWPEKERAEALD